MDIESKRHEYTNVLALVQQQMRDLAEMREKRSTIAAKATAASGTVEVTVDAQRMVVKTVIAETYLDDYELTELGGYITTAAQAAAREVERRTAALIKPLSERRKEISGSAGLLTNAPGLEELMSGLDSLLPSPDAPVLADGGRDSRDAVGEEDSSYPIVRS